MQKPVPLLLIFVLFFTVIACSSTKINSSWRSVDTDAELFFERMAVICLIEPADWKLTTERDFTSALKSAGQKSIGSSTIFSENFGGQEMNKEAVLDTLKRHQTDA